MHLSWIDDHRIDSREPRLQPLDQPARQVDRTLLGVLAQALRRRLSGAARGAIGGKFRFGLLQFHARGGNIALQVGAHLRHRWTIGVHLKNIYVHEREHEKHQKNREQEQRQRADIARAFAVDIIARQRSWAKGEQGQGAPGLGVEMEQAVQHFLDHVQQLAVRMRGLAAGAAISACERSTAIEAGALA